MSSATVLFSFAKSVHICFLVIWPCFWWCLCYPILVAFFLFCYLFCVVSYYVITYTNTYMANNMCNGKTGKSLQEISRRVHGNTFQLNVFSFSFSLFFFISFRFFLTIFHRPCSQGRYIFSFFGHQIMHNFSLASWIAIVFFTFLVCITFWKLSFLFALKVIKKSKQK